MVGPTALHSMDRLCTPCTPRNRLCCSFMVCKWGSARKSWKRLQEAWQAPNPFPEDAPPFLERQLIQELEQSWSLYQRFNGRNYQSFFQHLLLTLGFDGAGTYLLSDPSLFAWLTGALQRDDTIQKNTPAFQSWQAFLNQQLVAKDEDSHCPFTENTPDSTLTNWLEAALGE